MKVAHLSEPAEERVVFRDGLGVREWRDAGTGERVEWCHLDAAFAGAETPLRDRVSRLAKLQHVKFARILGLEPARKGAGPILVSSHVAGTRLAEVLEMAGHGLVTFDPGAGLQVAREVLGALAVLHDSRNVTHGALGPERVVLTPSGRVVMVEHVLAHALDRLQLPRHQLWRDWRIATPPAAGPVRFDVKTDLAQAGLLALAALLGRPIDDGEYPHRLRGLLPIVQDRLARSPAAAVAADVVAWLERLVPVESRRAFGTVREAQQAYEALVSGGASAMGIAPARLKGVMTAVTAIAAANVPAAAGGSASAADAPVAVVTSTPSGQGAAPAARPEPAAAPAIDPTPAIDGDIDIEALLRLEAELEGSQEPSTTPDDAAVAAAQESRPEAWSAPVASVSTAHETPADAEPTLDAIAQERLDLERQFAQLVASVAPVVAEPPVRLIPEVPATVEPLVDERVRWSSMPVEPTFDDIAVPVPAAAVPAADERSFADPGLDVPVEPNPADEPVPFTFEPIAVLLPEEPAPTAAIEHVPADWWREALPWRAEDARPPEEAGPEVAPIAIAPNGIAEAASAEESDAAHDDVAPRETVPDTDVVLASEPAPVDAPLGVVEQASPDIAAGVGEDFGYLSLDDVALPAQPLDEPVPAVESSAPLALAETTPDVESALVSDAPAEVDPTPLDVPPAHDVVAFDVDAAADGDQVSGDACLMADTGTAGRQVAVDGQTLLDPFSEDLHPAPEMAVATIESFPDVPTPDVAFVGELVAVQDVDAVVPDEAPAIDDAPEPLAITANVEVEVEVEVEALVPTVEAVGTRELAPISGIDVAEIVEIAQVEQSAQIAEDAEDVEVAEGADASGIAVFADDVVIPTSGVELVAVASEVPAEDAEPIGACLSAAIMSDSVMVAALAPHVELPDARPAFADVARAEANAEAADAGTLQPVEDNGPAMAHPFVFPDIDDTPVTAAVSLLARAANDNAAPANWRDAFVGVGTGVGGTTVEEESDRMPAAEALSFFGAAIPAEPIAPIEMAGDEATERATCDAAIVEPAPVEPAPPLLAEEPPATDSETSHGEHIVEPPAVEPPVVEPPAAAPQPMLPDAVPEVVIVDGGHDGNAWDHLPSEVPADPRAEIAVPHEGAAIASAPADEIAAVEEPVTALDDDEDGEALHTDAAASAAPKKKRRRSRRRKGGVAPAPVLAPAITRVPTAAPPAAAVPMAASAVAALGLTRLPLEAPPVASPHADADVPASSEAGTAAPARSRSLLEREVPTWTPPADLGSLRPRVAQPMAQDFSSRPASAMDEDGSMAAPVPADAPRVTLPVGRLVVPAALAPPPAAHAMPAPVEPVLQLDDEVRAVGMPDLDEVMGRPSRPNVTSMADAIGTIAPPASRASSPDTWAPAAPAPPSRGLNWRRLVAASVLIALFQGAAFAAWWWVQPGAHGTLVVQTAQDGVEVLIDGTAIGKTPFREELAPGRHKLTLRQGTLVREMPVEISLGVVTTQALDWPAADGTAKGSLQVTSTPAGAEIFLDGVSRGKAPQLLEGLPAGKQELTLRGDAGTVTVVATVIAGESTPVDVPIFAGWILVDAPVELSLVLNREKIGSSMDGQILMPPGTHRVQAVSETLGFRQPFTVTVEPGEVKRVTVRLPTAPMHLQDESGTEVFVDGDRIGALPGALRIPLGTHDVLIRRPDGSERRQTITVRQGDTVAL